MGSVNVINNLELLLALDVFPNVTKVLFLWRASTSVQFVLFTCQNVSHAQVQPAAFHANKVTF